MIMKLEALTSMYRSPWSMCILNKSTEKAPWQILCFSESDVFVDLTLLKIFAAYNYLYLWLDPVVSEKNIYTIFEKF